MECNEEDDKRFDDRGFCSIKGAEPSKLSSRLRRGMALKLGKPSFAWPVNCSVCFAGGVLTN
jgi:hypothetical protein